jgi:NAD(P)H-quinone oxidoreductase subunit 5
MGGLGKKMPLTASAFIVGSAGLLVVTPLGMFWTVQKWFNGSWDVPWWLVAVIVFVNVMSAINLVRTFRLVFLGPSQPKTRRAPEVPWAMAFPMASMIIMTIMTTFVPLKWQLWLSRYEPVAVGSDLSTSFDFYGVLFGGVIGVAIGATIYLNRQYTRSSQFYLRFLQDLFAYDFYIANLYNVTVVWAVSNLAKLTNWFDRYVVDGIVNLVTLATVLSGSTLKYNSSGQSQFYIFSIFLGVIGLVWLIFNGYLSF